MTKVEGLGWHRYRISLDTDVDGGKTTQVFICCSSKAAIEVILSDKFLKKVG